MAAHSEAQTTEMDPIKAYAEYRFDEDETYQQGLASILAGTALDPSATDEVRDEMIRKTRVFYFNKVKGYAVTLDEARACDLSLNPSEARTSGGPPSEDDENRVLTFAELKELIETGNVDKIPNNKIIPEGLNDAPPSQSTAPSRKKPWEKPIDQ
ncbi:hypothetical protein HYPSUDRAFT_39372 [Hypholoma sublateritium FD-334 SS-4]|uniref:Uncharacterized protein n=1 Tax=Hypholoma sublateritium (strain FD-334 SS-4) TaxID=945553 RepID=A0A0D2P5B3_HYPSF|nr:hypothetical protein HYPSUDRAFT_39372 [Hypholoma sublateritium FD-334 SS-4]